MRNLDGLDNFLQSYSYIYKHYILFSVFVPALFVCSGPKKGGKKQKQLLVTV